MTTVTDSLPPPVFTSLGPLVLREEDENPKQMTRVARGEGVGLPLSLFIDYYIMPKLPLRLNPNLMSDPPRAAACEPTR